MALSKKIFLTRKQLQKENKILEQNRTEQRKNREKLTQEMVAKIQKTGVKFFVWLSSATAVNLTV